MGEELDEKIRKTFEQVTERFVMYDDLRAAIGTFLANFAVFESLHLTAALRALSTDPTVIEYLAELMAVDLRLKLLLYLCRTYGVPEGLMKDVSYVRNTANKLREHRNEIAHGAAVLAGAGTSMSEIESSSLVPGVRRPASKRPLPAEATDVQAFSLKSLHTVPTIRAWAADAEALQRSTVQLADKLAAWKRGEAWDQMVVSKPTPMASSLFATDEG